MRPGSATPRRNRFSSSLARLAVSIAITAACSAGWASALDVSYSRLPGGGVSFVADVRHEAAAVVAFALDNSLTARVAVRADASEVGAAFKTALADVLKLRRLASTAETDADFVIASGSPAWLASQTFATAATVVGTAQACASAAPSNVGTGPVLCARLLPTPHANATAEAARFFASTSALTATHSDPPFNATRSVPFVLSDGATVVPLARFVDPATKASCARASAVRTVWFAPSPAAATPIANATDPWPGCGTPEHFLPDAAGNLFAVPFRSAPTDGDVAFARAVQRQLSQATAGAAGVAGRPVTVQAVTCAGLTDSDCRDRIDEQVGRGAVAALGTTDAEIQSPVVMAAYANLPVLCTRSGVRELRSPWRRNLFSFVPSDDAQLSALLAKFSEASIQSTAIVSLDSPTGRSEREAAQAAVAKRGVAQMADVQLALATASEAGARIAAVAPADPSSVLILADVPAFVLAAATSVLRQYPSVTLAFVGGEAVPSVSAALAGNLTRAYFTSYLPDRSPALSTTHTGASLGALCGDFLGTLVRRHADRPGITPTSLLDEVYSGYQYQTAPPSMATIGPYGVNCTTGLREVGVFAVERSSGERAALSAPKYTSTFRVPDCEVPTDALASQKPLFFVLAADTEADLGARERAVGIQNAFDAVNRNGGTTGGHFLRLRQEAARTPAEVMRAATDAAADDTVFGLVGSGDVPTLQRLGNATAPLPVLGPSLVDRAVRVPAKPYIITVVTSMDDEVAAAVDHCLDSGRSRIGVVHETGAIGTAVWESLDVAMINTGLAVVANGSYTPEGHPPFSTTGALAQLAAGINPPECLLLAGEARTLAALIPGARAQLLGPTMFYVLSTAHAETFSKAIGSAPDVLMLSAVPSPLDAALPLATTYRDALQKACATCSPTLAGFAGYITGRLAEAAVNRLGGLQPGESTAAFRTRFTAEFVNSGLFFIGGLRIGPYSATCAQGLQTVFFYAPTSVLDANGVAHPVPTGASQTTRACNDNATPRPEGERDLVFAQSAALQGSATYIGDGMRLGVLSGILEYNRNGGYRGRRVTLFALDDLYAPANTVRNVDFVLRHARHQLVGFLGIMGSATTTAIQAMARDAGVPVIGSYTGAGNLRFPVDPNMVNVRASYIDEAAAMVEWCLKNGKEKVFVFHQNDAFGKAGLDGVKMALAFRRRKIVGKGSYERGSTNAALAVVTMLQGELPDAVILYATTAPAVEFIKLVTFYVPDVWVLAASPVGSTEIYSRLDDVPATAQVFVSEVVPALTAANNTLIDAFKAAFSTAFPSTVQTPVHVEGYLAAQFALSVLGIARAPTPDGWKAGVYAVETFDVLDTTLGPYSEASCNQGGRAVTVTKLRDRATGVYDGVDSLTFTDYCSVENYMPATQCRPGQESISLSTATILSRCENCLAGQYGDGTVCRPCPYGTASSAGAASSCRACPLGSYQDRTGQQACISCSIDEYGPVSNSTSCRKCPTNAFTFREGATDLRECVCRGKFYGANGQNCQPCPPGATCCSDRDCTRGVAVPIPDPGFAVSMQGGADEIVSCRVAESCLGGSRNLSCAAGYTAGYCSECEIGYYRFGAKCIACGGTALQTFRTVMLGLFFVLLATSLVEMTTRESTYTSVSLTLNFFQICSLFREFAVRLPPVTDSVFAGLALATLNLQPFAPDCQLRWLYPEDEFYRAYMWLLIPVAFAVSLLAVFLLMMVYRCCFWRSVVTREKAARGRLRLGLFRLAFASAEEIRLVFTAALLRAMSVSYPVLLSRILRLLKCIQIEDDTWVLEARQDILCYDDRWYAELPVILFIAIGVATSWPAVLYRLLRDAAARGTLFDSESNDCKVLWPFTIDYSDSRYIWNLVECWELVMLAICPVVSSQPLVQLMLAMSSISLFGVLIAYFKPYETNEFTVLELVNDGVQILVLVAIVVLLQDASFRSAADALILTICGLAFCNLLYGLKTDVVIKLHAWHTRSVQYRYSMHHGQMKGSVLGHIKGRVHVRRVQPNNSESVSTLDSRGDAGGGDFGDRGEAERLLDEFDDTDDGLEMKPLFGDGKVPGSDEMHRNPSVESEHSAASSGTPQSGTVMTQPRAMRPSSTAPRTPKPQLKRAMRSFVSRQVRPGEAEELDDRDFISTGSRSPTASSRRSRAPSASARGFSRGPPDHRVSSRYSVSGRTGRASRISLHDAAPRPPPLRVEGRLGLESSARSVSSGSARLGGPRSRASIGPRLVSESHASGVHTPGGRLQNAKSTRISLNPARPTLAPIRSPAAHPGVSPLTSSGLSAHLLSSQQARDEPLASAGPPAAVAEERNPATARRPGSTAIPDAQAQGGGEDAPVAALSERTRESSSKAAARDTVAGGGGAGPCAGSGSGSGSARSSTEPARRPSSGRASGPEPRADAAAHGSPDGAGDQGGAN